MKISHSCKHCHVIDIITIYLSLYYNLPHLFYYNLRQSLLHFTASKFITFYRIFITIYRSITFYRDFITIYSTYYNLPRLLQFTS